MWPTQLIFNQILCLKQNEKNYQNFLLVLLVLIAH